MRVYADTSFLVRLVTGEPGSRSAGAEYRSLGRPTIFFLSLHALEVTNAIRQRAFHVRRSASAAERRTIKWETEAALAMLGRFHSQRVFVEEFVDMDQAIDTAKVLSERHTERLGCRGFDLLHVALALELECEVFLTADRVQGALARTEGMKATVSADE